LRKIDITQLKNWALKHLRQGSQLRDIILLEDDIMLPEEYLAKMKIWLNLYNIENNN